jgi:hypothetical protein
MHLLLLWVVANLCVLAVLAAVLARKRLRSANRSPTKPIKDEGESLEALLPWHATGTLSAADARRVEKALASNGKLARHFDLIREEINETILLNETLGAPSARVADKLFAVIDAGPARNPRRSFNLAGRLTAFPSSFSPRSLAWAGSVAGVLIILEASVIVVAMVKSSSPERSRPELASSGITDSSLAIIRFVPKANALDITNFLEDNKVSVIEGPKSDGMYTIRLPVAGQEKTDLIQQMQAQSRIVEFIATVQ